MNEYKWIATTLTTGHKIKTLNAVLFHIIVEKYTFHWQNNEK